MEVAETASEQDTEKILFSILKTCEWEAKINRLKIPLEDYEDRASYYAGISKMKLQQILKKNTSTIYPKMNTIDFNTHLLILKCLCNFYEQKKIPSFTILYNYVNEFLTNLGGEPVQDYEQFAQDVITLSIDYQTIFNDTKLLMEDPKITFQRYLYLKKITQLRQEKSCIFYYISERIIDKNYNFDNPWKQNSQTDDIFCNKECILFHAVSKTGLVNGLFSYSATEDDFYKWVSDILLDSLHPGSVVVLDNSPLHGRSKSKSITVFDTKSDMKQWLRNHNVPHSDTMNKSQLYQLVRKHADIEEIPRVDQIIKANGHQVLRLPTHFEDLSPVEHIWQDIKTNLQEPKDDLHDDILSTFANIPTESYELYENDIIERENALLLLDTQIDNVLDDFLSDLKDKASRPVESMAIE
ncbi:hypothetical protein PYW07_016570 [Mythimna separata]|uniref:Tc1-like transposase DDE domain-containing protein n=1 Tax=Mythimna separata TaxID=271217 RepID=A0AAD8DS80_MYTSE|nr:hypothetical protein PYW07_016570 [Mythimna separata]